VDEFVKLLREFRSLVFVSLSWLTLLMHDLLWSPLPQLA
jgi:hypothetical protein